MSGRVAVAAVWVDESDGSVRTPSASEPGVERVVTFSAGPGQVFVFDCGCPGFARRRCCRHTAAALDVLRRHGLAVEVDGVWVRPAALRTPAEDDAGLFEGQR